MVIMGIKRSSRVVRTTAFRLKDRGKSNAFVKAQKMFSDLKPRQKSKAYKRFPFKD